MPCQRFAFSSKRMFIHTCLRKDNRATLGSKELLALHHPHNLLSEPLHCRLQKQRVIATNLSKRRPASQTRSRNCGLPRTLKGSLSVLKLMPGTYLSQTGKPLHKLHVNRHKSSEVSDKQKQITRIHQTGSSSTMPVNSAISTVLVIHLNKWWRGVNVHTQNSTPRKCRDRCGDARTARPSGPS